MKNRFLILFVAAAGCICSCGRKYQDEKITDPEAKQHVIDANRALVHDEAKAIDEFISRHQWKMEMTGTGLHYQIYQEGSGIKADGSSVLTVAFKEYLLNGTLCYEYDEQHPLKLVTGKGTLINGLEEGLLMLNEGARARFVIPDHLAYGLTGDEGKIPPASALYCEVHLVKVEKPQTQK